MAGDRPEDGERTPLLDMLRRLPPSKELLDFYHSKLEKFAEEEQTWIKRFQLSSKLSDRTRNLEKELSIQKKEVLALQKAVNDMQEALAQERKINTKICGENDRLRIQEMENRRKVIALLELAGKTDADITRVLDNEDKLGTGIFLQSSFVSQRVKSYIERAKKEPGKIHELIRASGTSRLEIISLEHQLVEQEKCHMNQISQLENERRLTSHDRDAERNQMERRINELSNHINSMHDNQEAMVTELTAAKSDLRKTERKWMSEKETLMRKLQFVQHYGSVALPSNVEGGFYTDARGEVRRSADQKAQRQIQKLNAEVSDQKNLTSDYRNKLLTLEREMESLRDQKAASTDVLKKRTKSMCEQVETLTERYENLDIRRKREAEGYQADIGALKQKLKHLEQQLLRATITKAKEHDYIRTIRAYDEELQKLRIKVKQQWQNT